MAKSATTRRIALSALVAGLVVLRASAPADAHAAVQDIALKRVGGQFEQPIHVTGAPGFRRLLFVVEKEGIVRVLRRGRRLARPFLDMRNRVSAAGEQGLLSIAFPPDYRDSRRFYAYFTNRNCDAGCDIEVAEFRRSRKRPARALKRTYRKVISIPHREASNHNGGTALFGPDGKLWLATGDGGAGQEDNARRRGNLLGKLLRIIPRPPKRAGANRGYRIPRSNPFVGRPGRNEIWSIGLRNPFRFSFDPQRDAIAIGDVGQKSREEVNFVRVGAAKGANFGWPQYEGDQVYDADSPGPGPLIEPMHTYAWGAATGRSVVGGVVLRDQRFAGVPGLKPSTGRYLFGDFFVDELRGFVPRLGSNSAGDYEAAGDARASTLSSFGVGSRNRVYVTSLFGNRVYRLDPPE